MMKKLLIFYTFLSVVECFSGPMCPSFRNVSCQCSDTRKGYEVDCKNLDLTDVPSPIPSNTTIIYLSNNQISKPIFRYLPNLKELQMSNNLITTISIRDFSTLRNLTSLQLQGNSIETIHPFAFLSNPDLVSVYLEGNPLRCTCHHSALWNWAKKRSPVPLQLSGATCSRNQRYYRLEQISEEFPSCRDIRNPYGGYEAGEWTSWDRCSGTIRESIRYKNCGGEIGCAVESWQDESCLSCPEDVTYMALPENTAGAFNWPQVEVGEEVRLPCYQASRGTATRICRFHEQQDAIEKQDLLPTGSLWEEPDYSQCYRKNVTEELMLLDSNTGKENAHEVAMKLRKLTTDTELTANDVDISLQILNKIRKADPDQATDNDQLFCLSNLLDSEQSVLEEGEEKSRTSSRIVEHVDNILQHIQTKNETIHITPNLVVAALNTSSDVTSRGVLFQVVTERGDEFGADRVHVGFRNSEDFNDRGGRFSAGVYIPPNVTSMFSSTGVQFAIYRQTKVFQTMSGNQQLNSRVVVATIGREVVSNLSEEKIIMKFRHENTNVDVNQCVFWTPGDGKWSNEGCRLRSTERSVTTCECDHLTNFALLMDVYGTTKPVPKSGIHGLILSILTYCGLLLSLLGVVDTMIIYIIWRKELLKDRSSRILMCICLSLAMTYVTFLTTGFYSNDDVFCKVIAGSLHFFLLSSFTWMLVGAYSMYQSLVVVLPRYFRHFLLKASLFAWGVPLVVVAITVGVSTSNYGPQKSICWLRPIPFYAAFVSVVALIMIMNLIVFVLVVIQLYKLTKRQEKIQVNVKKNPWGKFRALVSISTLLGLTWVFGFIHIGEVGSIVIQYLFVICVTAQGLLIFVLYCLFKKDVRKHFNVRELWKSRASSNETKSTQNSSGNKSHTKDRKLSGSTNADVHGVVFDDTAFNDRTNEDTGEMK